MKAQSSSGLRVSLACLLLLVAGVAASSLQAAEASAEGLAFFESKIRPVLVAECYECHAGKESKGGLRLDTREALLKGGSTGPGLEPGNPEASLLIETLAHSTAEADLHMPKNGAKVDDAILQDFIKWVKMGAPDPRDKPVAENAPPVSWDQQYALRKQWWSLQPVKTPKVGARTATDAEQVDAFIFAKMKEQNLKPAGEAGKLTLIRRLSFALTGLPPKPDEVAAFVKDDAPDAWEKLVDHYLGSPAFGETWARHWMDLVRYAESHGSENDPNIPFAWRYRDYLIRAFNEDVPYDEFAREHVAGDLMKPRWNDELGINEAALATANLRLVEHGFQPVDSLAEQVNFVDNQIDVFSKTFLGLTVSCARCHDHKFDAISQKDYYALYGIFASTKMGQITLDKPERLNLHKPELTELKAKIKGVLAKEWIEAAKGWPKMLMSGGELDQTRQSILAELTLLRAGARGEALRNKGAVVSGPVPDAMACWTFDDGAKDRVGQMNGELQGGATIRNGRLVLNGEDAYMRTAPLPKDVTVKTLEAWVSLADLEQGGGGVVTIESAKGDIFDSITYAERDPKQWMVGSDFGKRTIAVDGPDESANPDKLIHVAIVHDENNRLTIYRDGKPYGQSYVAKKEMEIFQAGSAHVLLGRRHLGGGRAFLKGEIEEARLYDHALTAAEVKASHDAGVGSVSEGELLASLTPELRKVYESLQQKLKAIEASPESGMAAAWQKALSDSLKNVRSPLYPWVKLKDRRGKSFTTAWENIQKVSRDEVEESRAFNKTNFISLWDLTKEKDYVAWSKIGSGLPVRPYAPGEFTIEPDGDVFLTGIMPGGIQTNAWSTKNNALLASPYFKMDGNAMSFRMAGHRGGGVRVIVNNYPLGNNGTFPAFREEIGRLKWVKLDTTYRKGSQAYVEFTTYDDMTRPKRPGNEKEDKNAINESDGRSWFAVSDVVIHKGDVDAPREVLYPVTWLYDGAVPAEAKDLATAMSSRLIDAVEAWEQNKLTAEQQSYLDYFTAQGLLPVNLTTLPEVSELVKKYRQLEGEIPVPQRAPGPIDGEGQDAHLMTRGDPKLQGELVQRAFLTALGGELAMPDKQKASRESGRLELAEALTKPRNPLFSRVMVNRLWHWLFGKGLVGSVDNFGRLGDKPVHPELLDYLAARFEQEGYSVKKMVRLLATTQTWRMSSESSAEAGQSDPDNHYWSHARVRRLDAEMIRDAMLQASGQLDPAMYGEPMGNTKFRRSLYLPERRNGPDAFLEVFDRPKPSVTRGQRDTTNTPAQSLTMMNSDYVHLLAERWVRSMKRDMPDASIETLVQKAYEAAMGRLPVEKEMEAAKAFLSDAPDDEAWTNYLQAVFALKEFIYLR